MNFYRAFALIPQGPTQPKAMAAMLVFQTKESIDSHVETLY